MNVTMVPAWGLLFGCAPMWTSTLDVAAVATALSGSKMAESVGDSKASWEPSGEGGKLADEGMMPRYRKMGLAKAFS